MTQPLQFITGNERKFQEFAEILGTDISLVRVSMDLDEIQSLDPREVVAHKLREAEKHASGTYIVEDSSVVLACLNGKLPGPLVKWFYDALGCDTLVDITEKLRDNSASVRVSIGYLASDEEPKFFEGEVHGRIVRPRGTNDFGFGPVFQPDGSDKTFGEMTRDEKHAVSPRGIAVRQLRDFLLGNTKTTRLSLQEEIDSITPENLNRDEEWLAAPPVGKEIWEWDQPAPGVDK